MTLLVRCCLLLLCLATITACDGGVSTEVTLVSSPPTVVSTFPANGTTGVPLNTTISATFNKAMDPTTITPSTFILSSGNIIAPGRVIVSADGTIATFTITSGSLTPNITYTARITTGVHDSSGSPLGAEFTWTFSTGPQTIQVTAPEVVSTAPAANATGVDVATVVSAIFSTVMDPATGNSQTFTVSSAQGVVTGATAVNGAIATFTPAVALGPNTVYTATITTGFKDTAGIPLDTDFSWSFTTAPIAGTTPPVVTASVPATGATGVPLDQLISATFNKAMDPQTIYSATFTLISGGVPVTGTVALSGTTATFMPATPLNATTTYTATITTGAKDLAGNPLASPFVWNFTTGTM